MERVKDNVENELSKIGHGTLTDINQFRITRNKSLIKRIDLKKMCADVNEVLEKNVENSQDVFPTLFRNDRCTTVTHVNSVKAALSVLDHKLFAFSKKAAILAKKEPRHFLKSQKKTGKPKIRRAEQPEHLYEEPEPIHKESQEPHVDFMTPALDTIDIDVNLFTRRATTYDEVLSTLTAAQPSEPDIKVHFEEVNKLKASNTSPLCCRISDVHFTDVIKKTPYFPPVLLEVHSLPLWTEPVAEVTEDRINCFRKLVNEAYYDLPMEMQKSIYCICFKEVHEELLTETIFNDIIREIRSPEKSTPASTSGNLLVTMKSIGDEVEVSFADAERFHQFQTPRPIRRATRKQRQDFLLTTPQDPTADISPPSPLEFAQEHINDLGNVADADATANQILPEMTESLQQPQLAANSPQSDDSGQIINSIIRKKKLMAQLLSVIPRTASELLQLIKPKIDAGEEITLQTLFPDLNRFALLELYTVCLELPIIDNRIRIKQEKASKEYPIYIVRNRT